MGPLSVMNKYVVVTFSTSLSHSPCDQLQLSEGSLGLQASEILSLSLLQEPLHPPWTSLCPGASPGRWEGVLGSTSNPASTTAPKRTRQKCAAELSRHHYGRGRRPATASQGTKKEVLVGSRGEIKGVFSRVQTS